MSHHIFSQDLHHNSQSVCSQTPTAVETLAKANEAISRWSADQYEHDQRDLRLLELRS